MSSTIQIILSPKAAALLKQFPALESRQLQILEQELSQSQTILLEELESSEVITPTVKSVLYGELRQQAASLSNVSR